MKSGTIFGRRIVRARDQEELKIWLGRLLGEASDLYYRRAFRVFKQPENASALNDFAALDAVVLAAVPLLGDAERSAIRVLRKVELGRAAMVIARGLEELEPKFRVYQSRVLWAYYQVLADLQMPVTAVQLSNLFSYELAKPRWEG